MSLGARLILRFILGLLVISGVLFLPAGTWRFWQAWTFLAVTFTFSPCAFLYFYKHDRALLERRLRSKEQLSEQKRLIQVFKVFFFAIFLLPGFDYRLGWSRRLVCDVAPWASLVADAVRGCQFPLSPLAGRI